MHVIEFFYADDSEECMETLDLLEQSVESEDDIVLISYDIDSAEGMHQARERDITSVPTIIVDGNRVIRGVPHDPEQIFGDK